MLAKRAKGRALVDLIQKATAEPGIFAFAELLDLPLVKEVHPRHTLLFRLKSVLH